MKLEKKEKKQVPKKAKELHERSCEVFNKKCLAVSESKLIAGSCLKIISNKLDSIQRQMVIFGKQI